MSKLTIAEKAKLFDYIASHLDTGKFCLNFGGCDHVYHNCASPEKLAESLHKLQDFEAYKD